MSVETYTIAKVASNVRDVKVGENDFKSYGFTCEGHGDKLFSLLQKPDTAPPKAGDSFEATVKNVFNRDDGVAVTNLKRVQQQKGAPGQSKGPRTVSEEKWITARDALDKAVQAVTAAPPNSGYTAEGTCSLVLEWQKRFYEATVGLAS